VIGADLNKDVEFVRVFASDELAQYLFAKSLLDRDEIRYMSKGEALKYAGGWTPSGWIDVVRGPAELWVRSEDAERARALLKDLDQGAKSDEWKRDA
jgi:hypothetical protein